MHAQGLKDWGPVLASGLSPAAKAAFLLGTLIPLTEEGAAGQVFVNRSDLLSYVKSDVMIAGLDHLYSEGYAVLKAQQVVVGKLTGLRSRRYLMEDAVSGTVAATAAKPMPRVPAVAPAQPAPTTGPMPQRTSDPVPTSPAPAALLDLEYVKKEVINPPFEEFNKDMQQLRKQAVVSQVAEMVKGAIQDAEKGRTWNGARLMQYLSALVAIKHKNEVVIAKYTSKDLKQAGDVIANLTTPVLAELVPYFVFSWCDPGDQWKTPTVQTLMREQTKLLTLYKKKSKNGTSTGKFR